MVQHLVLPGDNLLGSDVAHLQLAEVWEYETLKHRNFTCVFAIIAPEAILPSMKRWVESLSHEGAEYDISKIQIQYVAEESI